MTAPTPITRTCRTCGNPFTIDSDELRWWEELGAREGRDAAHLPRSCTACRFARRREQLAVIDDGTDEWIRCVECGNDFVFGGRDRKYFAEQKFPRPSRCRPCRQARRGWQEARQGRNRA